MIGDDKRRFGRVMTAGVLTTGVWPRAMLAGCGLMLMAGAGLAASASDEAPGPKTAVSDKSSSEPGLSDEGPGLPLRNLRLTPQLAPAKGASLPAAVPKPLLAPLPGDRPTVPWTEAQVAAAKQQCARLLSQFKIDYKPLAPIRKGACGAPAPILVSAIGDDPRVEIDPPATMRCSLAAALQAWFANVVQPEARAELGGPVIKIRQLASYDCRNRYGRRVGKISEHARADAIDISTFTTASGRRVAVLTAWPAAGKAGQGGTAIASSTAAPSVSRPPPLPTPNPRWLAADTAQMRSKPVKGMLLQRAEAHGLAAIKAKATPLALSASKPAASPAALRPEGKKSVAPPAPAPQSVFIVKIHDGACRYFGTVLGPDANAAHSGHFHLDMIKRRKSFCQ